MAANTGAPPAASPAAPPARATSLDIEKADHTAGLGTGAGRTGTGKLQHDNHNFSGEHASLSAFSELETDHFVHLRTFQDLVGIRSPAFILMPQLEHLNHFRASTTTRSHTFPLTEFADPFQAPRRGAPGGRPKTSFTRLFWFSFAAENGGVYARSLDEEFKARVGFLVSRSFISFLYIIQIFVGATITGLAAYNGHKTALTILGAVNTILAGLLAFFKGQGLPNRFLKSRDQFANVVKAIEDTERMFARYSLMSEEEKKKYDPFAQAQSIEDLFDAAKKDQQENYPDIFVNNHEKAAVQARNESNRLGLNYTPEQMMKRIEDLEKEIKANDAAKAVNGPSSEGAAGQGKNKS